MTDQARHDRLEPGGVATWKVAAFAAAFWALMAISVGVLYAIFSAIAPAERTPPSKQFPPPRLQAQPAKDLNALIDQQWKELNTYRWVNAERTLITIPIGRAMEIIASRGDQAFAPIATLPSQPEAAKGQP